MRERTGDHREEPPNTQAPVQGNRIRARGKAARNPQTRADDDLLH